MEAMLLGTHKQKQALLKNWQRHPICSSFNAICSLTVELRNKSMIKTQVRGKMHQWSSGAFNKANCICITGKGHMAAHCYIYIDNEWYCLHFNFPQPRPTQHNTLLCTLTKNHLFIKSSHTCKLWNP